jgi:hypothetical protein
VEKGGKPFDPSVFHDGVLRAELVSAISEHCMEHSAKIADAVLARFNIRTRSIKEKIA